MPILKTVVKPKMGGNFVGAPSFATQNPGFSFLNAYQSDAYSSIYPSVKRIADEFKKIRPFAIDQNGKKKENVPALNALYHPNQLDSSVAFFDKLAVMNLTHRKTYLLVWRREGNEAKPGGELRANNIAGYTFLERPGISRRDNKTYYNVGSQYFTDQEVMVIPGGIDPNNLYGGYAPGEASRRWATLDQYIADYQSGFFENGAVPSGQFVITASSKKDYEDTVDAMQAKHRGAGKNNNVTYTPRPVDPATGKPADSKIEWIPFASTNREIDFKNLFEQANKRIDSTFGVPASVRGVGENNNYATARLDQQNFILRAVEPLALAIYTQITHELNRITGGLGVAITFNLPVPAVAEEEKAQAETKNVEVTALNALLSQGFSLDSVVDALQLSPSYKLLKSDGAPKIENDKPDVDEGDEVDKAPDPEKIDGVTPLNKLKVKNELTDYQKIYSVAEETMQKQINKAVGEVSADDVKNEVNPDPSVEEEDEFITEMMAVISVILIAKGSKQYDSGKELLEDNGVDTDNLTEFILTDSAEGRYRTYLRKVATSYMNDTGDAIRAVLAKAQAEGYTVAETKRALKGILLDDEYRIRRLAETELNRSQAMGSVESMIEIKNQTGATIQKSLQHTGSDAPCEFCAVLLDRWVDVEKAFIVEGESIQGLEGGIYLNDFADNDGHDLHPNGHCAPEYRVVSSVSLENPQKIIGEQKNTIKNLEEKLSELDGRSKEARKLKAEVEDMQKYIAQLEGIIDGQG